MGFNKKISRQSKVKYNDINHELEDAVNTDLETRVDAIESEIGDEDEGLIGDFNRLDSQLTNTKRINIITPNIDVSQSSATILNNGKIKLAADQIARWNVDENVSGAVLVAASFFAEDLDWEHISIKAFNYGNPEDEITLTYDEVNDLWYGTVPALEVETDASSVLFYIEASADLNTSDYNNDFRINTFAALTKSLPEGFELTYDTIVAYRYFDSLQVLYNKFSQFIKTKKYSDISFNSSGNASLTDLPDNIIPLYYKINDTGIYISFYESSVANTIGIHGTVNSGGSYTGANTSGTLYYIEI